MEALQRSCPDLNNLDGRVPHQRPVGEYPEIPIKATSQCLSSRRLPIMVRSPPIISKSRCTRLPIPVLEGRARYSESRFLRLDDLAHQGGHVTECFRRNQHPALANFQPQGLRPTLSRTQLLKIANDNRFRSSMHRRPIDHGGGPLECHAPALEPPFPNEQAGAGVHVPSHWDCAQPAHSLRRKRSVRWAHLVIRFVSSRRSKRC